MTDWDDRYNISGEVAVEDRLHAWCALIGELLQAAAPYAEVIMLTGDCRILRKSNIATFYSYGLEVHDYWVFVNGDPIRRNEFALELASKCELLKFDFSLKIHDTVQTHQ